MNAAAVVGLAVFALVATISPGGATTLATASGSQFGLRRSLPVLCGLSVGLASLAAAAGFGLTGLMLAVPALRLVTKIAGTAYLVWLAAGIARRGRPGTGVTAKPRGFGAGLLLLWVNPKGWAMTLAAAGTFGGGGAGPGPAGAVLAGVFGAASALSLVSWCWAGVLLARVIRTDTGWRRLNVTLAVLLVASVVPLWLE